MGTASSSATKLNPKEMSWDDIPHDLITDQNGLILNGVRVPEELLEVIFSYVDLKSIVSVNSVCQVWKTLSTNLSLWKLLYKSRGADWSEVPEAIKRGRNAWCVLYVGLQRGGFAKNMVMNGSGELGLSHWVISMGRRDHGSDFVQIESPPLGSDPLPGDDSNVCFATSYVAVVMDQTVKLGLTEEVMELMGPFEVRFSILTAARFDCGGKGLFRIQLQQRNEHELQVINEVRILANAGETAWQKYSFAAFFDGTQKYRDCRFLLTFSGQDRSFWAGYYGLKFSRISATIKFLSPDEAEDPEYPRTTVSMQPRG